MQNFYRFAFLSVCFAICWVAIASGQDDAAADLASQALKASKKGDLKQAIELWTKTIAAAPDDPQWIYWRGRDYFRAGKIAESLTDFDAYVAKLPSAESRQWERGISYYYAGEYEKGAKQFELYQTYHDQDVENSAWRYLCVAKKDGVEAARKNLLPIKNDTRVPMMKIFEMFQGNAKPEDVLKEAQAGKPTQEQLDLRLFYAHLYVGLWYEVAGEAELAKKHIFESEKHKIEHYMWDVAHIHADRMRAADKAGK